MVELDFRPAWYLHWRRDRLQALIQLLLVLTIATGLVLWWRGTQAKIGQAKADLAAVDEALRHMQGQLMLVDELKAVQDRSDRQDASLAHLRDQPLVSRIVAELDAALPAGVALTELRVEPAEPSKNRSDQSPGAGTQPSEAAGSPVLSVHLKGVAPAASAVAEFAASVAKLPAVSGAVVPYAKDHSSGGRIFREFEITFDVNAGGAP